MGCHIMGLTQVGHIKHYSSIKHIVFEFKSMKGICQ